MIVDTEDGLAVWDWAEGCELPAGTLAIERLGVGHRCETWLVWSVELWAPAVLKVVRPHQLNHPRAVKALRRETAALAGTWHPALPQLLLDGSDDTIPHLLLEYVDGPTLADELDEHGALPENEVALLGAQVLPALMTLHDRGLAHLDVKPDNVVLCDGRPILIDFGTARAIGSPQPAGHPVGTVGYASPDQEACTPVSVAMDIYSLGQTLLEAGDLDAHQPTSDLTTLLARLTDTDPVLRGTTTEALIALAAAAGDLRPWPNWLDRFATRGKGVGQAATKLRQAHADS
ncbi:serine/threonine-protein kinase [Kribbella sp. NPDC049174]|uniref:serine/threonine-protein kinase n=1 Tax=Kribbella sp. NPDC049174 TaxID=3364112 RepID=UPI003712DC42